MGKYEDKSPEDRIENLKTDIFFEAILGLTAGGVAATMIPVHESMVATLNLAFMAALGGAALHQLYVDHKDIRQLQQPESSPDMSATANLE